MKTVVKWIYSTYQNKGFKYILTVIDVFTRKALSAIGEGGASIVALIVLKSDKVSAMICGMHADFEVEPGQGPTFRLFLFLGLRFSPYECSETPTLKFTLQTSCSACALVCFQ
jgi:hypothetical protein